VYSILYSIKARENNPGFFHIYTYAKLPLRCKGRVPARDAVQPAEIFYPEQQHFAIKGQKKFCKRFAE